MLSFENTYKKKSHLPITSLASPRLHDFTSLRKPDSLKNIQVVKGGTWQEIDPKTRKGRQVAELWRLKTRPNRMSILEVLLPSDYFPKERAKSSWPPQKHRSSRVRRIFARWTSTARGSTKIFFCFQSERRCSHRYPRRQTMRNDMDHCRQTTGSVTWGFVARLRVWSRFCI